MLGFIKRLNRGFEQRDLQKVLDGCTAAELAEFLIYALATRLTMVRQFGYEDPALYALHGKSDPRFADLLREMSGEQRAMPRTVDTENVIIGLQIWETTVHCCDRKRFEAGELLWSQLTRGIDIASVTLKPQYTISFQHHFLLEPGVASDLHEHFRYRGRPPDPNGPRGAELLSKLP